MIRIAICDDDTKQLHDIKSMCERCLRNHTEEIRYTLYDSSFLLSEELERGRVFDIFLLDIYMPGISGLDIAAEIRRKKRFYNKCWGRHRKMLTSAFFFCKTKAYETRMLYNKSV